MTCPSCGRNDGHTLACWRQRRARRTAKLKRMQAKQIREAKFARALEYGRANPVETKWLRSVAKYRDDVEETSCPVPEKCSLPRRGFQNARVLMIMPPVPYTTETLAQLQARYPKALEHVYDQVAIEERGTIRPGECPANVFDFEDGLRLIVSREREREGRIVLHVSASFRTECKIAHEMRRQLKRTPRYEIVDRWAKTIPARFAELSGDDTPLRFIGWSDRMIPHWRREEA